MPPIIIWLFALASLPTKLEGVSTILRADNTREAYSHLNQILGQSVEVPDCTHNVKHITTAFDPHLNRPVFLFYSHRDLDGDSCAKTDRQRTEIKTTLDHLVGKLGETVQHSWNFWLDSNYKPSKVFSHIHQLKAVGGSKVKTGSPLITLTPRKNKKGASMEIIHMDNNKVKTTLGSTNLQPFLGTWIHVKEVVTYDRPPNGHIFIVLTRLSDGKELFRVDKGRLDMSRDGAEFHRSKWGLYRGLDDKNSIRNEIIRFDSICIAKGRDNCP